jgi:hypothetical protein
LVKGRYPSMADSNRAVARPNRLLQSYRRQSKTSLWNEENYRCFALASELN